jgi:CRP-like cAMP-binding protein
MDVLKEHPDLAPNVLKVLSDALKASQQQVHELERRLAEQVVSQAISLIID